MARNDVPDVFEHDAVTDACKRVDCLPERLFYKAVVEQGFPNPGDRAMALYRAWVRGSFKDLPEWTRDYVLRTCNGEFNH